LNADGTHGCCFVTFQDHAGTNPPGDVTLTFGRGDGVFDPPITSGPSFFGVAVRISTATDVQELTSFDGDTP